MEFVELVVRFVEGGGRSKTTQWVIVAQSYFLKPVINIFLFFLRRPSVLERHEPPILLGLQVPTAVSPPAQLFLLLLFLLHSDGSPLVSGVVLLLLVAATAAIAVLDFAQHVLWLVLISLVEVILVIGSVGRLALEGTTLLVALLV